jgi:hypothetical protein
MDSIKSIEQKWLAHKEGLGITARTCPSKGEFSYESRFWLFIKEDKCNLAFFTNWYAFDCAKVCFHHLDRDYDIWDQWKQTVGRRTCWNAKEPTPTN